MSVLNMMIGGSSSGSGFYTATVSGATSGSTLSFNIDRAPTEYVAVALNARLGCVGYVCDTTSHKGYGYFDGQWYGVSSGKFHAASLDNVSTTYANGVFTIKLASTTDGTFSTYDKYILYYR